MKVYRVLNADNTSFNFRTYSRARSRLFKRLCDLTSALKYAIAKSNRGWWVSKSPVQTAIVVEYELVEINRMTVEDYMNKRNSKSNL